jgi:hypothetical protein
VATERLSRLEDGQLLYRLKHRWRDGTTHVVFEPQELIEKLAALVPPPRFHLVRYHGVLGPCAGARDRVVPGSATAAERVRPPPRKPAVDLPAVPTSRTAVEGKGRGLTPDRCNPLGQDGNRATPAPAGPREPLLASSSFREYLSVTCRHGGMHFAPGTPTCWGMVVLARARTANDGRIGGRLDCHRLL